MVVPYRIKTDDGRHPELSKRAHSRIMKATMFDVAFKWAFDLLPEHFQKGVQDQFNYAQRTAAWVKRKAKLFYLGIAVEPDTDLVFRGRLRHEVTHSAQSGIRAYPSRATVTMRGPKYFTLRARSAHTARIAEEVLSMSPRHREILQRTADRGFTDAYRNELRSGRMRKTTVTS